MCASCGCGCKPGKEQKGCKCTCKTCREARTMSVEKFHLVRKAQRGFDAIADAVIDDHENDLLIDEDGNVYMLLDEEYVEKGLPFVPGVFETSGEKAAANAMASRNAKKAQKMKAWASKQSNPQYRALAGEYINELKRVNKGLPSIARQAMHAGQGSEAFARNSAMQWRLGVHNTGRSISREISSPGGSVARSGESIRAAQGAKESYRALAGMRNAQDRGKLGGRLGKERLASATAARQAKQNQIANRIRQNREMNGRGVLP